MAVPRHRRNDDDEAPLSMVPPDPDEDSDEGDGDEGLRHARRYAQYADGDDDEEGADQIIPDRVVRLQLGKPWAHLKIYAWLDYPEEVAQLFGPKADEETPDEAGERVIRGLRTVIVKHAGWRDRAGKLPQPASRAFWERISTPLSKEIIAKLFEAIKRNPTPPASKNRKPRG